MQAIDVLIFLRNTSYLLRESLPFRLKVMQFTVETRDLFVSFMETLLIEQMLRAELFLRSALFLEFCHVHFMFLNRARVFSSPFAEF